MSELSGPNKVGHGHGPNHVQPEQENRALYAQSDVTSGLADDTFKGDGFKTAQLPGWNLDHRILSPLKSPKGADKKATHLARTVLGAQVHFPQKPEKHHPRSKL